MKESKKWSLNQEDVKQILIKLGMALLSALVVFLADNLQYIDFGDYEAFGTVLIFMVTYAGQRLAKG